VSAVPERQWNYLEVSGVARVKRNHRRRDGLPKREGARAMLNWVVTLLIVALIAALLGFGGIAGAAVEIAKVIFFIAILLFLVAVVAGLIGRGGRGYTS
jgi:uncharacterized membrane protein YtjA (UPF0391 family)